MEQEPQEDWVLPCHFCGEHVSNDDAWVILEHLGRPLGVVAHEECVPEADREDLAS